MRRLLVAAASVAVLVSVGASGALAGGGQLFREPIDEQELRVETDFCEVEGLTVQVATHLVGRVHAVPHGPDGLAYFGFNLKVTDVVTNLANGNSVTSIATIRDMDLRVTDNGDGTLTILVLSTGNAVLYGEDGKVIARNPGQVRFEILIDHAGTPTDPSDDTELAFLRVVKESTGRTDDFCVGAVPILLGS
ncbi:MAG TPA: hypothetical protein VFO26_01565 [Gaiella sp.]|uniref:hypothetical protein n=1 Tax=Gaiella sp. TaxID=2663207 RepID=UPI002D8029B5|nr:hypothetical protein [Gaiella sp.]HET9286220.1 hypothetical protein [Gaiella sp.]